MLVWGPVVWDSNRVRLSNHPFPFRIQITGPKRRNGGFKEEFPASESFQIRWRDVQICVVQGALEPQNHENWRF